MKKSLILIMAFVIGMIMLPTESKAGPEPPGYSLINLVPSQASHELLAQAGVEATDQVLQNQLDSAEESEFHQATIEETSPPGKGINWSYLIPAIIGILEIIFRLIPTSTSFTPLSLLYNLISVLIPDRGSHGTEFEIKPNRPIPKT
jgi:hypothetical protein